MEKIILGGKEYKLGDFGLRARMNYENITGKNSNLIGGKDGIPTAVEIAEIVYTLLYTYNKDEFIMTFDEFSDTLLDSLHEVGDLMSDLQKKN